MTLLAGSFSPVITKMMADRKKTPVKFAVT